MPFREIIVAGVNLVRSAIQSVGFVSGSTGWRIARDGTAEFNQATVRGELIIGDPSGSHILGDISDAPDFVPFFAFYSGDSDEQDPAFITNDPIPASGRIPLTLLSSDRDDSTLRSEISLYTGSDAAPNDTFIELDAERILLRPLNGPNVDFDSGGIDVDAILTWDFATNILSNIGKIQAIGGFPVPCRIATTENTTASGAITTTETIVLTVTASLVNGYTYKVTAYFGITQSVATDIFFARIREDNATGNTKQGARVAPGVTNSSITVKMEAEYTAVSTANKTFVATLIRSSGTGNIVAAHGTATPGYIYVDYVRN